MIGRTLSKILSIGKIIGRNYHKPHEYPLVDLCETLDRIVLPATAIRYDTIIDEETEEKKRVVYQDDLYFSRFSDEDGDIKRVLAKAFDKRRKAKVGGTFSLPKARLIGLSIGVIPIDYEINRVDKNTIEVIANSGYCRDNRYLVSSSKEKLLEHDRPGFTPVHYQMVLF